MKIETEIEKPYNSQPLNLYDQPVYDFSREHNI